MKIGKHLDVLNSKSVKELMKLLNSQFGVKEKLNFVFLRNNKDKLYVVNRSVELLNFDEFWIDSIGLYFGKYQIDGFRLSVEGAQIVSKFATKNIVELNKFQKHDWFKGNDVKIIDEESRIVILKSGNDILGSAKIKNGFVLNSLPKSRRLNNINES